MVSILLLFLFIGSTLQCKSVLETKNDIEPIKVSTTEIQKALVGKWKEDQSKRTRFQTYGLEEQNIKFKNGFFNVEGKLWPSGDTV